MLLDTICVTLSQMSGVAAQTFFEILKMLFK